MTRSFSVLAFLMCSASMARAQMDMTTPAARAQLQQVERATIRFSAPESAAAAGFVPVFGWLPTMGTHWVMPSRLDSAQFDLLRPDNLMFSKVNGKQTLVGAAYAYFAPVGDSSRPASFDGNPGWHEHANLAPPGKTLAMLHVWFVPSPDGPFAGHNPNLPFWALGLTPPDGDRLHDPVESVRVKKTALALAEVADSAGVFPRLASRAELVAALTPRRATIRALIPELDAAQQAGDWARWDRAADRAAAEWDAIRETYLSNVIAPSIKERMIHYMDEMTSAGGMHHH